MNLLTRPMLALFAIGILAGCAAVQRAMPSTMSNEEVVAVFNTIDRSEEAAQLAQEKSSSQAVRDFAGRMIGEHTAMLAKRQQLGSRMNLRPEPPQLASALTKTHQKTMEDLRHRSGQGFDRAYLEYQVTMHEEAIKLAEETGESNEIPELKQHIAEAQPNLKSHLAQARSVQRQVVAQR